MARSHRARNGGRRGDSRKESGRGACRGARLRPAIGDERRRARRAIAWSADAGAQLINLSLGTANFANADRLASAVAHATLRGALVVSARESNDVEWLPGSLPGVVGVVADSTLERDMLEVRNREGGTTVFAASPYPRPIPGVPRERNLSGVSFAVANVTGFLARAVEAAVEIRSRRCPC